MHTSPLAKLAARFALIASLSFSAFAQSADVPLVRTADLGQILQNTRPIEVAVRPDGPRSPSIAAGLVEWRGEEGKEMARIGALPAIELTTNGNDLRSALRVIFEKCDMKYFIQEEDPMMDAKVTLSIKNHPWEILKTLSEIYHLEVVFRNGIWHCYVKNDNELVARSYLLRHNTLERFKSAGGGGAGGSATSGGGASGGSREGGPSIDRAGQSVYSVDDKVLKEEVEKIIGLNANQGVVITRAGGALGTPGARMPARGSTETPKGHVTFTSDTNTLWVFATRAQHELLDAWIREMDQPLKQIQIESKFLLTSVNPKSKIGVSNALIENGLGVSLTGLETTVNPTHPSSYRFPTAIFSASDLSARLNFMKSDSNTTTVQYPQQTTISGREVVLRSLQQIPIVSSSNRETGGSATSTQSEIEFVDVGTVVSILPKVLDNKNVMLNISITVSSISETVEINGNPYPVVSNQTYTNQVIVESGYSLALGGLEQTLSSMDNKRIPVLGSIPFFGFAFKDQSKNNSRSVLTMLVTPQIMHGYNGGNTSGIAQYTLPSRGTPVRKVFSPTENSTADDVNVSLVGFSDEVAEIEQFQFEGRLDTRAKQRAALLLNELELMKITLERERITGRSAKDLESKIRMYRIRIDSALRGTGAVSKL